ncbi:uncharacterized protein LOC110657216 [Hevea brasiliensis]|uniref:uncharacterized protein LOC110657216 n=1 Tax=Hevea brasiliensis TaxID=3981 RepID=UPI0025DEB980|nr:uncharacterized protein LOC110657216 [Hevea brasiliensis]
MISDKVHAKVFLMKEVMRFGKKNKLILRYIGPFEITDRVGVVAYQLELPSSLSHVHPIFHISILGKYVLDSSHVLQPDIVELNEDLTFEEQLVAIVDYQMRQLQSKQISMVKVL